MDSMLLWSANGYIAEKCSNIGLQILCNDKPPAYRFEGSELAYSEILHVVSRHSGGKWVGALQYKSPGCGFVKSSQR